MIAEIDPWHEKKWKTWKEDLWFHGLLSKCARSQIFPFLKRKKKRTTTTTQGQEAAGCNFGLWDPHFSKPIKIVAPGPALTSHLVSSSRVSNLAAKFPKMLARVSLHPLTHHEGWMDSSKWSENSFLLCCRSLADHGDELCCFFSTTYQQFFGIVARQVVKKKSHYLCTNHVTSTHIHSCLCTYIWSGPTSYGIKSEDLHHSCCKVF
jgi:hypothetical protein